MFKEKRSQTGGNRPKLGEDSEEKRPRAGLSAGQECDSAGLGGGWVPLLRALSPMRL